MKAKQQHQEKRAVAEREVRQALVKAAEYINANLDKYGAGITLAGMRRLVEERLSKDTLSKFKDVVDYELSQVAGMLMKAEEEIAEKGG